MHAELRSGCRMLFKNATHHPLPISDTCLYLHTLGGAEVMSIVECPLQNTESELSSGRKRDLF